MYVLLCIFAHTMCLHLCMGISVHRVMCAMCHLYARACKLIIVHTYMYEQAWGNHMSEIGMCVLLRVSVIVGGCTLLRLCTYVHVRGCADMCKCACACVGAMRAHDCT